jgi:hypothetical protein
MTPVTNGAAMLVPLLSSFSPYLGPKEPTLVIVLQILKPGAQTSRLSLQFEKEAQYLKVESNKNKKRKGDSERVPEDNSNDL